MLVYGGGGGGGDDTPRWYLWGSLGCAVLAVVFCCVSLADPHWIVDDYYGSRVHSGLFVICGGSSCSKIVGASSAVQFTRWALFFGLILDIATCIAASVCIGKSTHPDRSVPAQAHSASHVPRKPLAWTMSLALAAGCCHFLGDVVFGNSSIPDSGVLGYTYALASTATAFAFGAALFSGLARRRASRGGAVIVTGGAAYQPFYDGGGYQQGGQQGGYPAQHAYQNPMPQQQQYQQPQQYHQPQQQQQPVYSAPPPPAPPV
jgi:hypothetical protein